jgi:uncharacterized membrane protein
MKFNEGAIEKAIFAIILLVLAFRVYASMLPEAMDAGDELNASGVPLGGLFTSGGIVFLIIMAALIIVIVRSFLPKNK